MANFIYQKVINKEVITNPIEYVSRCERAYSANLRQIVREIGVRPGNNKIIMLSGPSSSGKTTTANMLARLFQSEGYEANVISLDDFYRDREEIEPGPDGKRDYEVITALNIDLIRSTLKDMIEKGETKLPYFDFVTGHRTDSVFNLKLDRGEIVIIEGLHAINPVFTEDLPVDCVARVYASTQTNILDDDGSTIFTKRDVRFLRRTIRDYNFRSSPVEQTWFMWPKVIEGEDKYLVPLIKYSDYLIDSFHPYEICIYKELLSKLFREVKEDSEYFVYAEELERRLDKVTRLDREVIPKTSLLREFVG